VRPFPFIICSSVHSLSCFHFYLLPFVFPCVSLAFPSTFLTFRSLPPTHFPSVGTCMAGIRYSARDANLRRPSGSAPYMSIPDITVLSNPRTHTTFFFSLSFLFFYSFPCTLSPFHPAVAFSGTGQLIYHGRSGGGGFRYIPHVQKPWLGSSRGAGPWKHEERKKSQPPKKENKKAPHVFVCYFVHTRSRFCGTKYTIYIRSTPYMPIYIRSIYIVVYT
jgi:hypothetical protein